MDRKEAFTQVELELEVATSKFGPMVSAAEGISIIREEYLELEKEVFWGHKGCEPKEWKTKMEKECIQLAAMAVRFLEDICDD